ncbi:Transposase IS200 like, partial [Succinivibrio dextrinosolvens]
LGELRNIFSLVWGRFESKLLAFDGEADHVHLLVGYPPKVAISKLVQALKGYSSLIIRKKNYPSIQKKSLGGKLFGHHPILHAVVEEPQFLLLDNI